MTDKNHDLYGLWADEKPPVVFKEEEVLEGIRVPIAYGRLNMGKSTLRQIYAGTSEAFGEFLEGIEKAKEAIAAAGPHKIEMISTKGRPSPLLNLLKGKSYSYLVMDEVGMIDQVDKPKPNWTESRGATNNQAPKLKEPRGNKIKGTSWRVKNVRK